MKRLFLPPSTTMPVARGDKIREEDPIDRNSRAPTASGVFSVMIISLLKQTLIQREQRREDGRSSGKEELPELNLEAP
jgi:hypothetical protein